MNSRTGPMLLALNASLPARHAILIGTLLLSSSCATNRDKQGEGELFETDVVEADDTDAAGRSRPRDGKVSLMPYYHPNSRDHIDAIEQSLNSLEAIPIARPETKAADEGPSE